VDRKVDDQRDGTATGSSLELTPAELRAIEDHKYYLSQERGREVTIEEAIRDFLENYLTAWRICKQRLDADAQAREIEHLRCLESERQGEEISPREAAFLFCDRFARAWREARESLSHNEFETVEFTVTGPERVDLGPASLLVRHACWFDCDMFLHIQGKMLFGNFTLGGKLFLHIRSILGEIPVSVARGDRVEIIAMGREAKEGLRAVRALLDPGGH
jgi:phosphotransferase system HPr-like phosphotransfer protein